MITVCILPAISFSILAYNKEKEIGVKVMQLSFANQSKAENLPVDQAMQTSRALGYYHSAFCKTYVLPGTQTLPPVKRSELWYDGFSAVMRRYIQDWGSDQNRLKFGASDSSWQWSYDYGDYLLMKIPAGAACGAAQGAVFVSQVPGFHTPRAGSEGWMDVLKFWSVLVFSIFALRVILFFFVSKLFLHEKYSRMRAQRFDRTFFESTRPGYKAFVTGMPSAGKSAYFTELTKSAGAIFRIDFVLHTADEAQKILAAALEPGPGIVIFDHFEHNLLDGTYTDVKLGMIEQLVANREKKVIIISSVQPVVFLNIVDEDGMKNAAADDNDKRYERWSRVLAAFYDFVYPLQGYTSVQETTDGNEQAASEELPGLEKLMQFVRQECSHGNFLQPLGTELITELQHRNDAGHLSELWKEREDIVIRIQKLADNYYRSIWNHLTIEEQFVLYDLAQDGLVNSKNQDIVEGLIDKGLVRYVERLRIMNRSFRNFILCVSGPTEIGELEKKVRATGAWSKLKLPLLLVVCTMLLFVIKSDRSQLFGVFTAITALIPVVVGLFTVFSQFSKKE